MAKKSPGDRPLVRACPRCDHSKISARVGGSSSKITPDDPRYMCDKCSYEFEEPVLREPNNDHGTRSGPARILDRMEKEAVDIRAMAASAEREDSARDAAPNGPSEEEAGG